MILNVEYKLQRRPHHYVRCHRCKSAMSWLEAGRRKRHSTNTSRGQYTCAEPVEIYLTQYCYTYLTPSQNDVDIPYRCGDVILC